jgi:ABC-type Fe3+/spermidine/putrescine transport system ATPase subunit
MSAVRLEQVSKSFGATRAVDRVDLEVESGQFVTLLGPSGCGKTTTLRLIAGFLRPGGGTVRIADAVVNDMPPHRREVGLVFQNYALFPHMTVRDNVAFGLRMRGLKAAEIGARVEETLELVRLTDRADHLPQALSGGQQQRVALARALVIRPAVLLLDEPFSALDRQLGEHMRAELRRLQQRLRISTLLVTHAQEEALMLSDRIAVMHQGRIEQVGSPTEVYERPRTRFVAEFVGRSNLLPVRVGEAPGGAISLSAGGGTATPASPGAAGAPTLAMVRPENLRLHGEMARVGPDVHPGRVDEVHYLGGVRYYRITLDNGLAVEAAQSGTSGAGYRGAPGSPVAVEIPPDALHLLER